MEIKLDTQAMNALFPEGSTARVDLQSAVIANLVSQLNIKYVKVLSAEITEAVKAEARKAVGQCGASTAWVMGSSKVVLSEAVTKSIQEAARTAITNQVHEQTQKAVEQFNTEGGAAERVNSIVDRLVETRLRTFIRNEVKSVLGALATK